MEKGSGSTQVRALTIIFGPQAFLSWFVSLPVQIAMYLRAPTGWLTGVGVAVWAVGIFFEAVGDAQMAAFRADPANRGQIMDRGLWRYTRHPNYFGDAAVWTGLFLIAAQRWPGVTTVASPFAMLYFLYFKSGKGLLEKSMAANRPGYREYMERTSGFFPLPPRRA
jgi:steroid 5-alpha reductase family enzyme